MLGYCQRKVINNIISSGELDETSIGFSDKSSGGRKPKIYTKEFCDGLRFGRVLCKIIGQG